jgi:hypothetical protein
MRPPSHWEDPKTLDRQGIRLRAHDVRGEIKRLRAKVRTTLATMRARRRELREQFKVEGLAARTKLREQIAQLRAAAKVEAARRRQALKESLAEIDREIAAARDELKHLEPAAKEYLRGLMLRGANLVDAKRQAAGFRSAKKRAERFGETLDGILQDFNIDRFSKSTAKLRAYIADWLRHPIKKNATMLERQGAYDPWQKYATVSEQWAQHLQDGGQWELAALQSDWGQQEADEMIAEADGWAQALDAAIKKGLATLEAAATCAEPEDYAALEQQLEDCIEYRYGSNSEPYIDGIEREIENVEKQCAARDEDSPFEDTARAGKTRPARAKLPRALKSKLRKGKRKAPAKKAPAKKEPAKKAPAKQTRIVPPVSLERPTPAADAEAIMAAHKRLDTNGRNMTLLLDLRRATKLQRARFDRALRKLREEQRAFLESSQGQAVRLTPEQRAAGIEEDGRRLVYFSERW